MEELQHAVDENVHAQLEENDDDGKGQIILHILYFYAVERRKTHLPWRVFGTLRLGLCIHDTSNILAGGHFKTSRHEAHHTCPSVCGR